MKNARAIKEVQGKNVLSFTKFVMGGFCPGVFLSWVFCRGFLSGGVCPGGCPDTGSLYAIIIALSDKDNYYIFISKY